MLINDVDPKTTWGFVLESAPAWLDSPPYDTPAAQVLKRGGLRVLDAPRAGARQLTIRGTIRGTTAADARTKADAFKLALSKRIGAKFVFDDILTRYVMARLQSFRIPPYGPSMLQKDLSVEASFLAHDPYSYETTTVGPITLDATAANHQTLGTGPSRPVITLTGAQTNPLLTLYDTTGTIVLGTMQFTVAMIAGDVLVIDCDLKTVKLNGASRLDILTTGDFFVFDPLVDTGPAIQYTSGGAGAATGSFTYRKSWQ
jgi:phage-related protein